MRRFYLWRREDISGVSGTGVVAEGVVFDDSAVVVRWRGESPTTTVHANIASVERVHCHGGATRLLWCDNGYCAPKPRKRSTNGGSFVDAMTRAEVRLADGWVDPNGAVDVNGVALFVGQRVRVRETRPDGAVGYGQPFMHEPEIVDIIVHATGQITVGLLGYDVGLCGVGIDKIEAVETDTKQCFERNGRKPTYGWSPALTIGDGAAVTTGGAS